MDFQHGSTLLRGALGRGYAWMQAPHHQKFHVIGVRELVQEKLHLLPQKPTVQLQMQSGLTAPRFYHGSGYRESLEILGIHLQSQSWKYCRYLAAKLMF